MAHLLRLIMRKPDEEFFKEIPSKYQTTITTIDGEKLILKHDNVFSPDDISALEGCTAEELQEALEQAGFDKIQFGNS